MADRLVVPKCRTDPSVVLWLPIWRLMLMGHCIIAAVDLADSSDSSSSDDNDDGCVYEANGETVCTIVQSAMHSAQNEGSCFRSNEDLL